MKITTILSVSAVIACCMLPQSFGQKNKKAKKAKKNVSSQVVTSLRDERIKNDSMTVMYGNALIEKIQEEGSFESYLHAASGEKLQIRSLAYVGDQVGFRIRASKFGLHLAYLVDQWKADRVIMAFGGNESYKGVGGLKAFKAELESYLDLIKERHGKADYILVSPIAAEKASAVVGQGLEKRNQDINLYHETMSKVANEHGIKYIDLYTPSLELFKNTDTKYTYDGMHLNTLGSQSIGKMLAGAITVQADIDAVDDSSVGFKATRELVSRKAMEVAQAYHPSNGISYYGLRARSYEYTPEIPHYLKLANTLDQAIWRQAQSLDKVLAKPKLEILRAKMPSKSPRQGLGTIKSSQEDLKDFVMHDGFEISCFASSEDYPELINPLQINFDAKGRLWVACFASYPHPLPGAVSNDTILIFEDTDGDGKADKRTVFAEGLSLPDGFVFYKDGIIASVSRKIIYLADSDGDSKADINEEIVRGLDNSDTHHSGYLSRSPRGDIIISEALFHRGQFETLHGVVHTKDTTIMSLNMDTRKLTVERQTESPNPWKVTFNKWGEAIQFYGGGQIIDTDIHNVWTPMGSSAPTDLGMPFRYDKGCTAQFVNSPGFPKAWQGGILTGHLLSTNEINYTALKLVDGAYKADGSKVTLVKSKNKIFRPSDMVFGLDGALYVSDFYYPIIGHAQHSIRDKNRDYANGRIWKITKKDSKSLPLPNIDGASVKQLIEQLKNPFLKVRQIARVELEKHSRSEIMAEIKRVEKAYQSDEGFALEILWLKENIKDFDDPTILNKLLASSDINTQRAAVKSLRWWAPSLGGELVLIVEKLSNHSDDRLKVNLVGVLSHLQLVDKSWGAVIGKIVAKPNTPLAYVKTMASWIIRPSIAAEFPILKVSSESYIDSKLWLGEGLPMAGSLYFKSSAEGELILGHENNPFINLTTNDTPLLITSGNPHSKNSQNSFTVKKGVNKIDFSILNSKTYKRLVKSTFKLYLTEKVGKKPSTVKLPETKDEHLAWKKEYESNQISGWKAYAVTTFKQNCANCHAIETKAVGPPLKGLFGKKQTVISADGSKSEITVDEAYIRNSILHPASDYPEGYQPIMPKMPLSEKEVDALVKWIKQL